MDQQNNQPNPPRPVPTEAEIARLEAEAVAALQRGEAPAQGKVPSQGKVNPLENEAQAAPKPEAPAFVPYVDDVPDPKPAPKPAEAADDDDDDEEYIPSEWEKRIDALTPEQWKRWQILGGGAVGLAVVACLFMFGQELATYGLIVAALLAILLPRYLERAWRRKLNTARYAMIVTLVIGLVIMVAITGARTGFRFTDPS